MKKPSLLLTVGAALCAGLLRAREIVDSSLEENPTPMSEKERAETPDPAMFGRGVPIEQTPEGFDYIVLDGKPVGLVPYSDCYDKLEADQEVILTEYGLRVIDRRIDLANPPVTFQQVWKDPDTGETKTFAQLPRGSRIRSYDVLIPRPGGGRLAVPLFVRTVERKPKKVQAVEVPVEGTLLLEQGWEEVDPKRNPALTVLDTRRRPGKVRG